MTTIPVPPVPSFPPAELTLTSVKGLRAAGVKAGIKASGNPDVGLLVADVAMAAAGVFTRNHFAAAPVLLSRAHLAKSGGVVRAVVVNSGNANACTGAQGDKDAKEMCERVAAKVGCPVEQVLVCSTGVIGRPMPMPVMESGIPRAAQELAHGPEALERAARAILTTDTRIKVCTHKLGEYSLTGFAKGAAMIGPNMATMLAFVLTDAPVDAADLAAIAPVAADCSFNCISVEGHTSTNDTLLILANGAGPKLTGGALDQFRRGVIEVCAELARAMAADAEGASHLVRIDVEGARTDAEARTIAKTVAESALVKTALFGADPNWGRIVSAAGYAGVPFEERELSLWLGEFLLYDKGTPLPFDAAAVSGYMKANRDLAMRLVFTHGFGRCTFYTCDLTYDYVRLNADYTT